MAATRWQPAAVDPCRRARNKVFRGTVVWTALFAASTMGGSQARRLMASVISFRTVVKRFVWSILPVALATRVS